MYRWLCVSRTSSLRPTDEFVVISVVGYFCVPCFSLIIYFRVDNIFYFPVITYKRSLMANLLFYSVPFNLMVV